MGKDNRCGGCTACCVALDVRSLRKDEFQPCPQICGQGCAIYERRPGECRDYECVWLKYGQNSLVTRPDRLGAVMDLQECNGVRCLSVREVGEHPAAEHLVASLAYGLAQTFDAMIMVFRKNRLPQKIFPSWVSHLESSADQIVVKSWRDLEDAQNEPTARYDTAASPTQPTR